MQVLTDASSCLTDPAILSGKFSLADCPSLDKILVAVQNNVTNPVVTCDEGCVQVFSSVRLSSRFPSHHARNLRKSCRAVVRLFWLVLTLPSPPLGRPAAGDCLLQ